MLHKILGVRALYPRLHEPHNFNANENRSMPCAYDAMDAKYECSFVLSKEAATEMAKVARKAFNEAKKPDWIDWQPKSLSEIFKPDEDIDGKPTGNLVAKTVKKTYGEKNNAPQIWLADGTAAPEGFRIINGSIVHALIKLAPWNYAGRSGVQFRLQSVGVVQLADAPMTENPFKDDTSPNGVTDLEEFLDDLSAQKPPSTGDDFQDDIPF